MSNDLGHHGLSLTTHNASAEAKYDAFKNENESSFIHLAETNVSQSKKSSAEYAKHFLSGKSMNKQKDEEEFFTTTQRTSTLVELLRQGDYKSEQSMSQESVERLNQAIEEHVLRLKRQSTAYVDAVRIQEQSQDRNTQISLQDSVDGTQTIYDSGKNNEQAMSFIQEEIKNLELALQQQQSLSQHLTSLLIEQENRASNLNLEEDFLMRQMNDLELQTRNLQGKSREMATKCLNTLHEKELLMSTKINSVHFLITNFHKDIEKNPDLSRIILASNFPLINGLRLTHKASVDVHWNEVHAAWSQVAQLLLFAGGILNYSSDEYRIIPLTNYAKIIQINSKKKKIEHALGQEMNTKRTASRKKSHNEMGSLPNSLIPLNHFLYQLIDCALKHKGGANLEPLPFQILPTSIGKIDLTTLNKDGDDEAWFYVVNGIAATLEWLSFCSRSSSQPKNTA